MLTENSSFGGERVGAVDRPDSCRPTSPTVAVLCASRTQVPSPSASPFPGPPRRRE